MFINMLLIILFIYKPIKEEKKSIEFYITNILSVFRLIVTHFSTTIYMLPQCSLSFALPTKMLSIQLVMMTNPSNIILFLMLLLLLAFKVTFYGLICAVAVVFFIPLKNKERKTRPYEFIKGFFFFLVYGRSQPCCCYCYCCCLV